MSLKLTDVSKSYGAVEVLKGIDIEIEQGDFLVLLGGSGCGKSTLLNCIAGLEEVSAGQVAINGADVTQVDPSDRNVAMVFQSYALYPTMTVARNISFGLECQGVKKKDRNAAVAKVAETLQITQLLDRRPSQLSGGQRQRVAIGRALVRNPDVFLLDEPMSNLDAQLRNEMRFELRELHRKVGATFVLVTHDQIEAMSMATKIAVMDAGIVQQFGTPYDIYYYPRNMFVASFIGLTRPNFIQAKITYIDGEPYCKFGGNLGSLSRYDFFGERPPGGTEIILSVRPEDIYRDKDKLVEGNYITSECKVMSSELTGGDVQVWFDFDGQQIGSRFRSTRTPENGALTTLYIDMQNVSVFDKESELRL